MFKLDTKIITVMLSVFAVAVVIWSFTGNLPPAKNPYNSFSLQAESWLSGRLDLGANYEHLEIANYDGKYYVSFPPFVSMLLLPFVMILGVNTPDALISVVAAAAAAVYAMKIARFYGKSDKEALFWSLFITIGGNLVFVMTQGWVWFIAQTIAFSLSMAAIYYALKSRSALSFFLWACAVGCRPFSAIYLPVLIYISLRNSPAPPRLYSFIKSLIPAALMAIIYMLLNYLRFDNPLEFGHNYLPEFIETEQGQFSLDYIPQNIINLFRLPALSDGYISFPAFDGFAFFIASPIFIAYIFYFIRSKKSGADIVLSLLLVINLLLLTTHKTMGGWQFGNRYTIDLLPFVYIGLIRLTKDKPFSAANIPLLVFGTALNVAGTIMLLGGLI